ncbi:MAG: acetate--CoA ligase family protein [Candidatus Thermoplasmatota archaeon]|jgi:hypothetical protein|nr:acetate--CoA ligase family protein [Candidatus Thermoplasmatota archaeon]
MKMKAGKSLGEILHGEVTEFDLKMALREYGFRVPRGLLIDAVPASIPINFPVVLKVSDPRILHKSELGGVSIGIGSHEALDAELSRMRKAFPGSHFLIEEMVTGGVEMIVGVSRNRDFGLSIMVGLGGIFTELYGDAAFRLLPIERQDAIDMIEGTTLGKFVEGFRGKFIDRESLVKFLLKVSGFAEECRDIIDQMDMNPVMASGKEITVLDAKLIKINGTT